MPTLSQVVNGVYNGMGFLSGLFGGNSDPVANARSLAKYNAELNYQYSQKYAENGPAWQRKGLESAGYNPMLALGNIGTGMSTNTTGLSTGYDPNSKATNALRLSELMNNIKAVKSQADLNYKQGLKTDAEAYSTAIDNYWKPSVLEAQVNATNTQSDLNKALTIFKNLEIGVFKDLTSAQIGKLKAEAFSLIKNAMTNENVGNSTSWFNYNRSLGKTTSGSIKGFGFGGSYSQTR